MGKLLVVGSVALDTVKTPFGEVTEVLGGSATYFSTAASYFTSVDLIAVVGEDFPEQHVAFLKSRKIDLTGLERRPDRLLLPGMFVRARVPRGQPAEALLVPQQAISRTGGKAGVWVVDAQDHAQRMPVDLGELVGRDYLIRSGLQEGQRVVVEGGERLTDGAPVAPKNWQAAGARAPAR